MMGTMQSSVRRDFLEKISCHLEHEHLGSSSEKNAWSEERHLETVEACHASYMSVHWWLEEEWEKCRTAIQKINLWLGYRLQRRKIIYPSSVTLGEMWIVRSFWGQCRCGSLLPRRGHDAHYKREKGRYRVCFCL